MTWFKPGGYNQICDRTGFKVKNSETQREWTNSTVRKESWEHRHPQDLIRSIPDYQAVSDPNPEQEDVFLATNEASEAILGINIASHVLTSPGAGTARRINISSAGDHLIWER